MANDFEFYTSWAAEEITFDCTVPKCGFEINLRLVDYLSEVVAQAEAHMKEHE